MGAHRIAVVDELKGNEHSASDVAAAWSLINNILEQDHRAIKQRIFIKCIPGLTTGSVHSSHNPLPVLARPFATER
jgi:transposase-like protein